MKQVAAGTTVSKQLATGTCPDLIFTTNLALIVKKLQTIMRNSANVSLQRLKAGDGYTETCQLLVKAVFYRLLLAPSLFESEIMWLLQE